MHAPTPPAPSPHLLMYASRGMVSGTNIRKDRRGGWENGGPSCGEFTAQYFLYFRNRKTRVRKTRVRARERPEPLRAPARSVVLLLSAPLQPLGHLVGQLTHA